MLTTFVSLHPVQAPRIRWGEPLPVLESPARHLALHSANDNALLAANDNALLAANDNAPPAQEEER